MPSPTALGQMRNTKFLASRLPHGSFRRNSLRMDANLLGFAKGGLFTRNTFCLNSFGDSPVLQFPDGRHDAIDDLLARLFRVGDCILIAQIHRRAEPQLDPRPGRGMVLPTGITRSVPLMETGTTVGVVFLTIRPTIRFPRMSRPSRLRVPSG